MHAGLPIGRGGTTELEANYELSPCLHRLFEAQVARSPENLAVVCNQERWTYGELNARANRLADELTRKGIGVESIVGLYIGRSVEMLVGMLGILKAGAAYLPLDPAYPQERLLLMLRDAGCSVVVTHSHLHGQMSFPPEVELVCCDKVASTGVLAPNPPARAQSRNLAYVLYTSGSTGRPNGVAVQHASVVTLLRHMEGVLPPHALDCVLASTSMCFDISLIELFGPLLCGGRVIMVANALQLSSVAGEQAVTMINTVPSAMAELLRLTGVPDSVKVVVLAGEPLRNSLAQSAYRNSQASLVLNCYGPTECTIYATVAEVQRGVEEEPSIGTPVSGTAAYVLDEELQPVPPGTIGELYLGGEGLARGYLNRPGLTASKFVPDVNSRAPGARMYRTGDLASWSAGGALQYFGRIDHQVKVRGFRIELREIESILERHPSVRESVVVAGPDASGNSRLVAYVVPARPGQLNMAELRRFLMDFLPTYMMPSVFVPLEALPHTLNGKIDRKALPAPKSSRPDLEQPLVAPRNLTEATVAQIWSSLLGVDEIGIHDHFLDLGGHSLIAVQIVTRINREFAVQLPLAALFELPTVELLSRRLGEVQQLQKPNQLPPLRRADRTAHIPLSLSQEQVWFLHQLDPENIAYQFQITLRLTGPLDPEVLKKAIVELVRRHEVLRTAFTATENGPGQVVMNDVDVAVPMVDLSTLPPEQRSRAAEELIQKECRNCRFDLGRPPLVRWWLLRLSANDHILLQIEHHFVHDGWSISVLTRDLATVYEAFAQGRPSPLKELQFQFADYAAWQRDWMQGEALEECLAFWRRKLHALPPALQIPADRPRPEVQSLRGSALRIDLPRDLYESLRIFSRRLHATLFMTMLAAFKALLLRYTGETDMVVGSASASRVLRETEPILGMFVNSFVTRTDLSGDPSFLELLQRVKQGLVETYAYQQTPFIKVVQALRPDRDISRNPFFQVAFNFHDAPVPDFTSGPLKGTITERHNGSAKFDYNIICVPRAEQRAGSAQATTESGLTLIWEYNAAILDEETARRFYEAYETLLQDIVRRPQRRISELQLRPDVSQSETPTASQDYESPEKLFEACVAARPDATALRTDTGAITYAELNERANRLAHYLRRLKIGPDKTAAILAEPGVEQVVAILAIMKAGGAFVQLSTHPPQALARILDDTGAGVVLTLSGLERLLPDRAGLLKIYLDTDSPKISCAPCTNVHARASSDHLACIAYPAAGTMHGVMLSRRALAARLSRMQEAVPLTPSDRVLPGSGLWGSSIGQILWPLVHGASLVVPREGGYREPDYLIQLARQHEVTVACFAAEMLQLLLEEPALRDCQSIRHVVVTGNKSTPTSEEEVSRLGWRLHQFYEAGDAAEALRIGCGDASDRDQPILAGRQVHVLDSSFNPVPIGAIGELCLGGETARGYLRRGDLTAAAFIPNPLGEPGTRIYRTGNVVRLLSDDRVQSIGRTDSAGCPSDTRHDLLPARQRPYTENHESARNHTEAIIAEAWCEILGLQQVWVQENFFDIGGTSLNAIELRLQLQRVMELDLPSRIFFESPTVEAQARFVERAGCEKSARDEVAFAGLGISPAGPAEGEDLESLRNRVEQLSDEEVDRLLNEAIADGD